MSQPSLRRSTWLHGACLVLCALLAACGGGGSGASPTPEPTPEVPEPPPPPPPPPEPETPPEPPVVLFEDVTESSGMATSHDHSAAGTQAYLITGQAWGDYDNDGDQDLYLTDISGPNHLWRNEGDGTFVESPLQDDVALADIRTGGALWFDYDNDGWKDLYVLNWGANVLFRNVQGTGFVAVTAGVEDEGRGYTASVGDYDGDGWLDMYVANWGCPDCPGVDWVDSQRDRLFHNEGDGTFTDVSERLGIEYTTGFGFVTAWFDMDDDGDLDLYLVNDKGLPGPDQQPMNRNVLWRNDGPSPDGWVFTEIARDVGLDARVKGMGVMVGDVDNDLDLDVGYSHVGLFLHRNDEGATSFPDITTSAGLYHVGVGWGLSLTELNRDGNLDVYFCAELDPNGVWLGRGDGTFLDIASQSGADDNGKSLGMAACDFDNDGWMDILVANFDHEYRLYRGIGFADPNTPEHHWVTIRCVGGGPVNRDAIGTRVTLTRTDGAVRMQEVKCGSSVGSGEDTALMFGLAEADIASISIRWPDGTVTEHTDVERDGTWVVTYPTSE